LREGQQTVNQRASAFGGLQSTPNQWRAGGILAYPVHCQSQIADHDRKQVVEVVGDTPGQLTDNLKLLRLAQSRLSGLPFRDFCLKAKVGSAQFKSQSRRIG
jgi:hypothetical protein